MRTRDATLVAALVAAAFSGGAKGAAASEPESLYGTVAALDAAVFDTFNRCSEPGQLDKHASYFAADVEFYHDNGGVTWTRIASASFRAARARAWPTSP